MTIDVFNQIVLGQINKCTGLLLEKGHEYAPGVPDEPQDGPKIIEEPNGQLRFCFDPEDRLAHFKKAAALMNSTPKAALLGMLTKHIVSVSDMCLDGKKYSTEKWEEKITDSINYLLILRALVEEEKGYAKH